MGNAPGGKKDADAGMSNTSKAPYIVGAAEKYLLLKASVRSAAHSVVHVCRARQ